MITYLDDDSFFTNIHFPGQYGWSTIMRWVANKNVPCFRIIFDEQADIDFLNLKDKLEIFPGTKTFATVMNPWARSLYCYNILSNARSAGIEHPFIKYFNFDSFESFVLAWPETQFENSWFKLSTPQIEWLEYTDENGELKIVDYIMRAEYLDEDFKSLQSYFCLEEYPLEHIETYPEYQKLFSTEMKNHIEKLFYKDIERFQYKF